MNKTGIFLLTVAVRFCGGALLGCGAVFVFEYRFLLRMAAQDAPGKLVLWLAIGGVIGGLVGVCTIPRHEWPWRKNRRDWI